MLTISLESGNWTNTFNAENRIIVAESATAKLEMVYDYMGRRVSKKVYSGSTSNWTLVTDNCFVYDNYVQIEELDTLNSNAILNKRIWSNGKISCDIRNNTAYYALGDANKNITEYIDASGTIQAHYEYSPFGKITTSSGTMKDDFDFRFSSEVFDTETGLSYYNFRYYSPELGRWLSRDPIKERGGVNLYTMLTNNAVNWWDLLGLRIIRINGQYIYSYDKTCKGLKICTILRKLHFFQWRATGETDTQWKNMRAMALFSLMGRKLGIVGNVLLLVEFKYKEVEKYQEVIFLCGCCKISSGNVEYWKKYGVIPTISLSLILFFPKKSLKESSLVSFAGVIKTHPDINAFIMTKNKICIIIFSFFYANA